MTNSRTKPKPNSASGTTKKNQLIKLLDSKSGADIRTLSDKLGWQQHTTRAAMSGLRKAGYEVAGEKRVKGGALKFLILLTPKAPNAAPVEASTHGA